MYHIHTERCIYQVETVFVSHIEVHPVCLMVKASPVHTTELELG